MAGRQHKRSTLRLYRDDRHSDGRQVTLGVRIAETERRIAALEQAVGIGDPNRGLADAPVRFDQGRGQSAELIALFVLPIVLLLLAHYLLIIVFSNLSPMYLFAASVILPLPFGFLVSARGLARLPLWFAASIQMALMATLGMSAITALVDGSDVLPQNRRDLIELVEFTICIALSYSTGIILGKVFWRRMTLRESTGNRAGLPYRIARRLVGHRYNPEQAHRAAATLLGILRLFAALATIVGSVYSGWQRFSG